MLKSLGITFKPGIVGNINQKIALAGKFSGQCRKRVFKTDYYPKFMMPVVKNMEFSAGGNIT